MFPVLKGRRRPGHSKCSGPWGPWVKCRVSSGDREGLPTRRGFQEEAAQMEDGIGRCTKGKEIILEEGKN